MATMTSDNSGYRVWDPFVRLFHWTLVACIVLNLFVLEEGDAPHRWSGYVAASLIVLRMVWGFVGSRHARFADFWPTRQRLQDHWQRVKTGEPDPHPGHNPAGALMMLALMAWVLALGLSGYMMGTDAFWGEEWLENLHEFLADGLMALAGMHVLAAIVMSHVEGVNLPRAMITGVKHFRRR
ncbi:cytochrome b/b6 domain-containing protein [Craterilacuibacter sp.]|uniref:cytochrome b/b6 domain-containing protein n=1 Tax=Craterilacuibacter sp. TaxID=2870909 RepID=UPI003F39C4B1